LLAARERENAELRRDRDEAREQQTATADVLRAIRGSPTDVQPVLDQIVRTAARLSGSGTAVIWRADRGEIWLAAMRDAEGAQSDPTLDSMRRPYPLVADAGLAEVAILSRRTIQAATDAALAARYPPTASFFEQHGIRGCLAVPLMRGDVCLGALCVLSRQAPAFSESHTRLVQTFADQAVIALENARLFAEIAEKSRQLEEASRHKSEFLASMSHELRTPLNAILGYGELVRDGIYGQVPDRVRAVLERVDRSGRHLLSLINDVLDLSKIEAGHLTLSLADYSLRDVIRSVGAAVEPLARAKGLRLAIDVPAELPTARGDERRVTQVLLNLAANAVKFTEAGEVRLRACMADASFVVSVADTGPGIAEADQERIFEEFQQAAGAGKGGPASVWRSPSGSSSCMAGRSRSRPRWGTAPRSRSRCRCARPRRRPSQRARRERAGHAGDRLIFGAFSRSGCSPASSGQTGASTSSWSGRRPSSGGTAAVGASFGAGGRAGRSACGGRQGRGGRLIWGDLNSRVGNEGFEPPTPRM
jgi:signal transduction histidine kinase